MIENKYTTLGMVIVSISILLFGCEEKEECDAVCEEQKAEFELLTTKVGFSVKEDNSNSDAYIYSDIRREHLFIKKNETGAVAEYYDMWPGVINETTTELSKEEWLGFLRTLYKCYTKEDIIEKEVEEPEQTQKRDKSYKRLSDPVGSIARSREPRHQNSYFKSGAHIIMNSLLVYRNENEMYNKPYNRIEVEKLMDSMLMVVVKREKNPVETKLKEEYEKRFGEPITDYELSINKIDFYINGHGGKKQDEFNDLHEWDEKHEKYYYKFFRTIDGMRVDLHGYAGYKSIDETAKFDDGEWLELIRAFRKLRVNEWEEEYKYADFELGDELSSAIDNWMVNVCFSNKFYYNQSLGYAAYPPNWDEFKKVMDGITGKVKIKADMK